MIDIELGEGHDLKLTDDLHLIRDRPEVMQSINIRVLMIRFEWAFAYLLGIPWTTGMFDIRVPKVQKETIVRETILGTVGVRLLTSFLFNIDRVNKGALITYSGETEFGPIEGEASV